MGFSQNVSEIKPFPILTHWGFFPMCVDMATESIMLQFPFDPGICCIQTYNTWRGLKLETHIILTNVLPPCQVLIWIQLQTRIQTLITLIKLEQRSFLDPQSKIKKWSHLPYQSMQSYRHVQSLHFRRHLLVILPGMI